MPIPRSRTWLLLAGTIVLQIAIIRSATVLKRGLSTHPHGEYDPGGVYKRDPTIQTTLPYSEWYNTSTPTSKPFIAFGYLLLLSFLFSFIGIVASDFFCPNLSTIATYLGLSETTAGVTFLAFGNGSPDVFSTFSAMNQGTFSLAIGELIGAATFITSVVVGSIALIRPFYVPKTAFIRDVSFFTAAVIVLVVVLHDGHLTLVESTAMVALYLLYVVVVIIMNVMAKEKRHTTSHYAKSPEENGWKSLPGNGDGNGSEVNASGGFGAGSPIASRPASLHLPSPGFGPVDRDRADDGVSAGSLTPTGPGPRPGPRRGSNPHSHFHLDLNHLRNTPDYPETPRANFSLLGAIEFRDVVNSLKREGASRTPSPGRSPHATVERTDYFTAGHRRSVSHAPLRRSSANAHLNPSSSGPNRSRAISHVVQPGNMATFTMTPTEISPSTRMKLSRAKTAPGLDTNLAGGGEADEEVEELLSPVTSEYTNQNPWKDQHGHPPSKPVLPKLSIPDPIFKKGHGGTPSISIVDPSGHVEEPIYSPSDETPTPFAKHAPTETRFRIRHRTRMILNVLFPSLQSFRHKSIIGMILSIFSVPAILVLTLTLPVVDDGDNREGGIALPESDQEPLAADLEPGQLVEEDYGDGLLRPDIGEGLHHLVDGGFSPLHSPLGRIHSSRRTPDEYQEEEEDDGERGQELMEALEREESFGFNKSLTAAQCIFGPTFCTYVIFSEMEYMWYILLTSLVLGSAAAIMVIYTATDGSHTAWRMVRCFGGFTCSMVWIAAIADEVVTVLQSIGELMGLSDAIIGLTIFAIGNSMADLVANITVAQFAPAMAYAACFGGPMLNLLLGVGGSGTYHLLFHPHEPVKLHFSPTLWVSATGLIIILLTTAVVVPLNGYLIDRRWAGCLMVAYGGLMVANIVVEIKTGRA